MGDSGRKPQETVPKKPETGWITVSLSPLLFLIKIDIQVLNGRIIELGVGSELTQGHRAAGFPSQREDRPLHPCLAY